MNADRAPFRVRVDPTGAGETGGATEAASVEIRGPSARWTPVIEMSGEEPQLFATARTSLGGLSSAPVEFVSANPAVVSVTTSYNVTSQEYEGTLEMVGAAGLSTTITARVVADHAIVSSAHTVRTFNESLTLLYGFGDSFGTDISGTVKKLPEIVESMLPIPIALFRDHSSGGRAITVGLGNQMAIAASSLHEADDDLTRLCPLLHIGEPINEYDSDHTQTADDLEAAQVAIYLEVIGLSPNNMVFIKPANPQFRPATGDWNWAVLREQLNQRFRDAETPEDWAPLGADVYCMDENGIDAGNLPAMNPDATVLLNPSRYNAATSYHPTNGGQHPPAEDMARAISKLVGVTFVPCATIEKTAGATTVATGATTAAWTLVAKDANGNVLPYDIHLGTMDPAKATVGVLTNTVTGVSAGSVNIIAFCGRATLTVPVTVT